MSVPTRKSLDNPLWGLGISALMVLPVWYLELYVFAPYLSVLSLIVPFFIYTGIGGIIYASGRTDTGSMLAVVGIIISIFMDLAILFMAVNAALV